MAMSASTALVNKTGRMIMFTSITQVNDDSTWDVNPAAGKKIQDGEQCLISMGNSSAFIFPKGVGFEAHFVDSDFNIGGVTLDDPAIGKHEFSYSGNFNYKEENPSGNSYVITIKY